MTERMIFDDETLMAFADGELDAATAAAVERAIETDDALMMRVALFIETRAAARDALADAGPVPAALEANVRTAIARHEAGSAATIASLDEARTRRFSLRHSSWQLPLAASLVTAIAAGAIGYQLGRAPATSGIEGFSTAGIAAALDASPSGAETAIGEGSGRIRMISSFRDQAGTLCREYEIDRSEESSVVAVSCRHDAAWTMRFAVAAPARGDGYAPASSLDALEAYLGAIEAGPALTADEEAAALAESR